ncbi:uncharacterized protein KD926_008768 [Aspergillus affinis]|uniref:uncharacterized protein n=1 Tax=Aspergillus affinis TaxID=1070780 RepID=UPI0022FEFB6E|nr:uncharacterized protein KD926_008768 [Aspergillus affinis]KAI9045342.1 hypothetical protein KD926_008768 [Aspergillus affinis]
MDGLRFPVFNDGDVMVRIGQKAYQLHSDVLRRHSRLFRHALQDAPRFEGFVHFYLTPSELSDVGILEVQKTWDSSFPMIERLFDEPAKVREYWDNILRVLYKIKPNLYLLNRDPATVAFELVDLGATIGSKTIVDHGVDLALRDFGQQLFLMISEDPVGWLFFGNRIRSGLIYHEALVHLVGKWHQLPSEDQARAALLPEYTENIVIASSRALERTKENVEASLLTYTPSWISLEADIPYLVENCMLQAVGIFRQWFCHQVADANSLDNWGARTRLYRTIAAGGNAYLEDDKLEYLHGSPIYWGLAEEHEIDDNLNLIKDGVKLIVAPLLVNESRYDPQQLGRLPYLTCIRIEVEDIPWNEWAVEDGINGLPDIGSSDSESSSTDSWVSSVHYSDDAMVDGLAEMMEGYK